MKNIKTIISAFLLVSVLASCKKVSNDDVSFLTSGVAPSDLRLDVSVNPAGVATITPSGTGVASFDVYFDAATQVPEVVLPGGNVVHTYLEGDYTVRLIAKNLTGGQTTLTKNISVVTSTMLVDFETPATTYGAGTFGGSNFAQANNPSTGGINASANVGQITKGAAGFPSETWAGITINTTDRFLFASLGRIKMKVYSNHVGGVWLFKLEGPSSGGTVEKSMTTTVANAWEELTFDMDPSVIGRSFGGFSIFNEFGTSGDGSANFVGLFDDIKVYP
jgi:hypothetical protein